MKKIISIVSLLLIAAMIMAIPTVAAGDTAGAWTPPEGILILYANDLTGKDAPIIDGTINPDEYGKITIRQDGEDDALPMADTWPDYGYKIKDNAEYVVSDSYDFYFAYDETSIYIAIKEIGGTFDDGLETHKEWLARNNYGVGIGFQLDDLTNYFALSATGAGWNGISFSDGKLSNFTSVSEGISGFVSEMFVNKYLADDPDTLINYGDIFSPKNSNSSKGPYVLELEFKFDKDQVLEMFNNYAFTGYANLPDAMYFSFKTQAYRLTADGVEAGMKTGHYRYLATDIRGKTDNYFDYGMLLGTAQEYLPTLVVFGDENTVLSIPGDEPITEAPATEAPTTEAPATEAPAGDVTEAPAGDVTEAPAGDATEAPAGDDTPDTEPAKGGCGGSVSLAGLALIAALGTCTVFVAKKKED